MSLDKAIEHGKEHRKQYHNIAQQVDMTCRCHGGCQYCLSNRIYQTLKEKQKMLDKLLEWEYNEDITND